MKIAVATKDKMVSDHFGYCEKFNIYDSKNNEIAAESSVPCPEHKPGRLPNFLADMGVNVIISGGMGGGAVSIFNEKNIEVIVGATGDSKSAAESYLKGELKSTGAVCHDHTFD